MLCSVCDRASAVTETAQCGDGHATCHGCVRTCVAEELQGVGEDSDKRREFSGRNGGVLCPHEGCGACIGPRVLAAGLDDATYAELSGAQAECIREGAEEAEQRVCVVCLDEPADYMCLPAATSAAARTASPRLAGPATAAVPSAAPGPTRSSVCSASTQEGDERRREEREKRGGEGRSGESVSQRQRACGSDGDNRKEREGVVAGNNKEKRFHRSIAAQLELSFLRRSKKAHA